MARSTDNAETSSETDPVRSFRVRTDLPEALRDLETLAQNLWWTWQPDAADLFHWVDARRFEQLHHNAVALLQDVDLQRLDELAADPDFVRRVREARERMDADLHCDNPQAPIAYFCAEFGLHESLRLYSGGLGVLAGDTLKSASDLKLPVVAVGLAYREGYFEQAVDGDGWQQESYPASDFGRTPLQRVERDGSPLKLFVEMGTRTVTVDVWCVHVGRIPLYLLSTDAEGASDEDRAITARLYAGDRRMRIEQEVLLGIGGVRLFEQLGIEPAGFHMNEGHSAFLTIEQTAAVGRKHGVDWEQARRVAAASNLFTTHTPVPAGHDEFDWDLAREYLAPIAEHHNLDLDALLNIGRTDTSQGGDALVSMTLIGLRMARYRNGVSRLHGEVSRSMWGGEWPGLEERDVPIEAVTNGVHNGTWLAPEWHRVFAEELGSPWLARATREPDRELWSQVRSIPLARVAEARRDLRGRLVARLRHHMVQDSVPRGEQDEAHQRAATLDPEILTIGFARRFATYKRATLLFSDLDRLERILRHPTRPMQIVFAGKAHPQDDAGKQFIQEVFRHASDPRFAGRIVFLDGYDLELGRLLTQGVDVWLNTPRRPHEASGTSGMKAAMNGGLNLSILDGWWCEGFHGDNGWAIGEQVESDDEANQDAFDAASLYDLLENEVAVRYYEAGDQGFSESWMSMVKEAIAVLSATFSSHRMMLDYDERYYREMRRATEERETHGCQSLSDHLNWWSWVGEHWDGVEISHVEADLERLLQAGDSIPVAIQAKTAPIDPNEVCVEILYGPLDEAGVLIDPDRVTAELRETDEGLHRYEANIECRRTGPHGMSVRLRPQRAGSELVQAPTLVRWARLPTGG